MSVSYTHLDVYKRQIINLFTISNTGVWPLCGSQRLSLIHILVDSAAYRRVADKLHTYIPESSIVGILLEHAEDYAVIDSSNRSIMQHEPMSWNVEGPRFVHLGQRSPMGKVSDLPST